MTDERTMMTPSSCNRNGPRAGTGILAVVGAMAMFLGTGRSAIADVLRVPADHSGIQVAIDAAPDGTLILVDAGIYEEDIDFRGKALVIEGAGPDSVIRGTGTGPVVTIASGERDGTTLDSFTITGGLATLGGAILIQDTSPRILRNVIVSNAATGAGSGIYVGGAAATPLIANNLMIFNAGVNGADPHTIQVVAASPRILNNTVVRNDSNAVLTAGGGAPDIRNNIFARNGTRFAGGGTKGRGICDFADGSEIHYNVFFRNVRAAILVNSVDYATILGAEAAIGSERLTGNRDAAPRFSAGPIPRSAAKALPGRFLPSEDPLRASRVLHAGDPSASHRNLDGSRNTAGVSGGPFAPVWARPGA